MAVKVERRMNLAAGVEVAYITNALGMLHQVQQAVIPLAEADGKVSIGKNRDGSDFTELDLVRDWHDGRVEMEAYEHCVREQKILRAAQMLGHATPTGATVVDPMEGTGWKGCCGG